MSIIRCMIKIRQFWTRVLNAGICPNALFAHPGGSQAVLDAATKKPPRGLPLLRRLPRAEPAPRSENRRNPGRTGSLLHAVARCVCQQRLHDPRPVRHAGHHLPCTAHHHDVVRQDRRPGGRHAVIDPRERDRLPAATHLRPDRRPREGGPDRRGFRAGRTSALPAHGRDHPLPADEVHV